jgi:hypothetical protein
MIPEQRMQTDTLNNIGANLQQDIAGSKTKQATTNVIQGMENDTQRLARLVADNAFSKGMQAKQLIFSESAALADYAFEALQNDFQSGRISQKEIRDLGNTFVLEATKKKNNADQMMKVALESFQLDMANGNAERAKSRILAAMAAQKASLEEAAKAQATSKILEGIVGAAATYATGGNSALAGALGKVFGGIFG